MPTAVRLARRLEPYRIGWFEEPTPPESLDALRAVREQVSVPICVGERLYTRWDFLPVLEERLADYIMPDVVWTGGISEMMRIATLAEAYHVPVTPHNAMGPLQVVAGAHAMLAVPNFYRLEHNMANVPWYNRCLDRPLDFRGDRLHLSERPRPGRRARRGVPPGPSRPRLAGLTEPAASMAYQPSSKIGGRTDAEAPITTLAEPWNVPPGHARAGRRGQRSPRPAPVRIRVSAIHRGSAAGAPPGSAHVRDDPRRPPRGRRRACRAHARS